MGGTTHGYLAPAEDIWTAKLCLDGYSDDELAVLFGISADAMSDLVARFIDRIGPDPERKYASLLSSPASLPESKCAEPVSTSQMHSLGIY